MHQCNATPPAPGRIRAAFIPDDRIDRHPTRARGNLAARPAPHARSAPPHPRPGEPALAAFLAAVQAATPPAPGGTPSQVCAIVSARRHPTRARGNQLLIGRSNRYHPPPHPRPGEPGTVRCVCASTGATPPAPGGTTVLLTSNALRRRHPTRARGNRGTFLQQTKIQTPPHPRPGEPLVLHLWPAKGAATPPAPGGTE